MTSSLPLTETNLLPQLIQDYLSKKESVIDFYNLYPAIENFKKQIQQKSFSEEKRKVLHEAIKKQYQSLSTSEKLKRNIELLLENNTYTVVTAHQTNIFTGPLYVIYKILHVIKLAELLNEKLSEYQIIPVYWMGSEDHDFEEINHIHIEQQTYTWQDKQGGATGRYQTDSLRNVLLQVKQQLQNEPYAAEVFSVFENAYKQPTLAQATQFLINELLGKYGIIVVNQDDVVLKNLLKNTIKEELLFNRSYNKAIETSNLLSDLGYTPQASPRPINLFYLENNIRERIVFQPEKEQYEVLNTSLHFSEEALMHLVEKHPEKFSPNVFLRPLYQETVLPNLAYVGGSGELSYWLQQKNIFASHEETFPLLIHRNAFTLIEPAIQKKLEKLKMNIADFWKSEDEIIKQYIAAHIDLPDFKNEYLQLKNIYAEIKNKAQSIDPTLKATADAQLQQCLNALENLEKKIIKAAKQKEEQSINQLKTVKNKITPENILQERFDNILLYYCRYGTSINSTLLESIKPLNPQMNVIYLQS